MAGAKKYTLAGDAFGSNVKVGESRNITFPLSKAGVPDGTAEIEGEVVKATLVNADGTDGPGWKNDDLAADERIMAAAPAAAPGAVATGTVRPGTRPPRRRRRRTDESSPGPLLGLLLAWPCPVPIPRGLAESSARSSTS